MLKGQVPNNFMFSFIPEYDQNYEVKEENYGFSGNDSFTSSRESSPSDVPQVENDNNSKTKNKKSTKNTRTTTHSKNHFQELPTSPEEKDLATLGTLQQMEQRQEDGRKHRVSEKRAEQNRQAQKSFRERKVKYVKELEEKLERVSKQGFQVELLQQENSELRNVILSLQKENETLKKEKQEILNFTWNPGLPVEVKEGFDLAHQNSNTNLVGNNTNLDNDFNSFNNTTSPGSFGISSPQDLQYVPCTEDLISSPQKEEIFTVPEDGPLTTPSWQTDIDINSFLFPETVNNQENFLGTFDDSQPVGQQQQLPQQISVPHLPNQQQQPQQQPQHKPKRNLEEADFYSNYSPSFIPIALSRNELGSKNEEDEICDLFKQIHCKDKNPELCHSSKFVKKAI